MPNERFYGPTAERDTARGKCPIALRPIVLSNMARGYNSKT